MFLLDRCLKVINALNKGGALAETCALDDHGSETWGRRRPNRR
jgi:hypothetical protein